MSPSTTDSGVVLDGGYTVGGGGASGSIGSGAGQGDGVAVVPCIETALQPERCFSGANGRPQAGEAADPGPAVTITDVAVFAPTASAPVSEPDGWGIAGLPVNLIGPAAPSVVPATLLGAPAEVRFTPVSWRWDLGDGAAVERATPGQSWAELGLPEFAATDTSHTYADRGTYAIGLTVVFTAEYRVGGGAWIPVPGVVALPAPATELVIGEASTVLVDRDCARAPAGPGC